MSIVSCGVLLADSWRPEEERVGEEVEDESEDIDCGEVNRAAYCGAAADVEEWLRVEG